MNERPLDKINGHKDLILQNILIISKTLKRKSNSLNGLTVTPFFSFNAIPQQTLLNNLIQNILL